MMNGFFVWFVSLFVAVTCFELCKVCFSRQRLFSRHIEKSLLLICELPFRGVVLRKDEALRRLFLDDLYLD